MTRKPRPRYGSRLLVPGAAASAAPSISAVSVTASTTGTWTPAASMTVARTRHTATPLLDGRVLVVGTIATFPGGEARRTGEVYDPASNTWSPTRSLRIPRWRHTATLLADGTVLVAGGLSSGGIGWPRDAEQFDPSRSRWRSAGTMNTSRSDAT